MKVGCNKTKLMIPKNLYRGDSDKDGDRLLKSQLRHRLLFTNLISRGNGSVIFNKPLIELVKNHINPGWSKTHFLSFTESIDKALKFGSHEFSRECYPKIDYDNDSWDFALLVLNTGRLSNLRLIEKGVYECFYKHSLIEFQDGCKILLVNTVEYLKANMELDVDAQLKNAQRDEEWLVLPLNKILLNKNTVQYSAKIDMSDIIEYELYSEY